jgi:hypothetical protein
MRNQNYITGQENCNCSIISNYQIKSCNFKNYNNPLIRNLLTTALYLVHESTCFAETFEYPFIFWNKKEKIATKAAL